MLAHHDRHPCPFPRTAVTRQLRALQLSPLTHALIPTSSGTSHRTDLYMYVFAIPSQRHARL